MNLILRDKKQSENESEVVVVAMRRADARRSAPITLVAFLSAGLATGARAADNGESETELAKKTQNPVADIISVPFKNDFYFNTGSKDAKVYALNVEPVIPFHLTSDWNLITRTIVPVINQPRFSRHPWQTREARSAWGTSTSPSFFRQPSPGRLSGEQGRQSHGR
jgi:hypothetical protein